MKPSRLPAFLRRALALAAFTSLGSCPALAATWYWDTNSGTSGAQQAAGTWSAGGSTWWNGAATVAWDNGAGNTAHFGTDAGVGIDVATDASRTVTVSGTVNASGLAFNTSSTGGTYYGYILTGGALTLANGSSIDISSASATDANRRHQIYSPISGAGINITRTTTANTNLAMLRLNGSNTWTGNLTLSSAPTSGIFVEAFGGTALNTLSTVTVGVNSSMILAAANTFTPNFSINGSGAGAGANRGAIRFDTTGAIISGTITLAGASTINATSGITGTISGSINQASSGNTLTLNATGGGNLIFNANNNFVAPIILTSGTLTLNGNNSFAGNLTVTANSLTLAGTNTFTGTSQITINGGSLSLGKPGSVTAGNPSFPQPIRITGGANTIFAVIGPDGFTMAQFASLPTLPTMLISGGATMAYGMSLVNDIDWDGALMGASAFAKGGPGTLTLLGDRTDSGGITIREGSLRIHKIAEGGHPSPIGTSSAAAASLVLSGGRLTYAGPEVWTERLFTMTASSAIEASGSGPLHFDSAGTIAHTGTAARTLTLTGTNTGANSIRSIIPNAGAGAVSITKNGHGNWTLSAANTASGTYRVDNGILTLDYTTNDPLGGTASLTGSITTNGGLLVLKGGAIASESIATWTMAATQSSGARLKLENMALTVGTLTGGSPVQRNDFIDLSENGSITINALAGNFGISSGILMGAGSAGAFRGNIVLRAPDSTYAFPTLSGGASGTLQKLATYTDLIPGTITMNNNAVNYRLKQSGTYTANANLNFCTMTLDTTAGPITLNVNTYDMSPLGLGKAYLLTGPSDVTLSGSEGNTDAGDDSAQWFHNYLGTGAKFDITADFGNSQYAIFGGTGFTVYRGFGFTDNLLLNGGIFRPILSQTVLQGPTAEAPNFKISNGAVLEIGTRLTEDEPSIMNLDFTKSVDGDVGGVRFFGDSGLSAYTSPAGGKRVVKFSVKTLPDYFNTYNPTFATQSLVWGGGFFLVNAETAGADADAAFLLSSPQSNATIEIQNPINLNRKQRVVRVANGSAAVDAELTGELSGSKAAGIVKTGPGTLMIEYATYEGETRVLEGELRLPGSSALLAESTLVIENDATVHIPDGVTITVASVTVNGVLKSGVVTGSNITGTGTLISGANLPPYEQWVVDNTIAEAQSAPTYDADNDGLRNLIEYAVGSPPKTPNGSVLSITRSAASNVLHFNHPSGRTDISFVLESSPTLGSPWTTIAVSVGGAPFQGNGVANVSVSEVSNAVTVTDNRAGSFLFYRLRADK